MARQRTITTSVLSALCVLAVGCSGDDDAGSEPATTPSPVADVVAGAAFPEERCAANRAAGTISYLSGFDFAATASIVEVLVAEQRGYYDELCLDVDVTASFSTANYPLVAGNDAQFASAGSFSEVVSFGEQNDADLVVLAVEGRTAIDALITKDGEVSTLADLQGATIGVKGKITSAVAAMLAAEGLVEGEDYETVLIDGYDPKVHIELPGIVGFPGFKSNEPGQLERAGIPFDLFDPSERGIPGSFGVLYTNQAFLDAHPSAAIDFMRASMRGLRDALDDPKAASDIALALINAHGNPNFLSPEGEVFRWETEAALIMSTTPPGVPYGVLDLEGLQAEVDTYAEIGLFGDETPSIDRVADPLLTEVYATDGTVIWPAAAAT